MSDTVRAILDIEWEMFSTTKNEGEKAACQENKPQFTVMRAAQFSSWDEELHISYLNDLKAARESGRNLMAEKYAYMMESTSPDEYNKIKHLLPPVTGEKEALVKPLVEQTVIWAEELHKDYPKLASCGRPIYKSYDNARVTSAETYHRGEALTYGERTLSLLGSRYRDAAAEGRNLYMEILKETILLMGYNSLEEAENSIKNI